MSDYCYISGKDAQKLLFLMTDKIIYRGDVFTNLYQMVQEGLCERKKSIHGGYVYKLVTKS
jgi:hypothetical protein